MATPESRPSAEALRRHWARNRAATAALILVWFVVTFVVAYFARDLNFAFFDWPFSFWMGAQGALLVYLAIVVAYAWYAERLDRRYGVDEDDGGGR